MNNKRKIFNDPIYGFISIPDDLIFELIEHPYFQRLRRISQLGLTHFVYPGAHHTRFHHALGAMHLMSEAIEVLRSKGHDISEKECQGALAAILLHDIGHGPFSHTLEHSIVDGISHEDVGLLLMEKMNDELEGKLDMALKIFNNTYSKKFLHQLVSSQLDIDRMDYLKRDSFYSGVSEGVISSDRLIKMMEVVNDELAIEYKGIYSVEKFLIARRLMYWQVYLHKTVLSAEFLLMKILKRAKCLAEEGKVLFCTPNLRYFLYEKQTGEKLGSNAELLDKFASLDDFDILASIKVWSEHDDRLLAHLSNMLTKRKLFKAEISKNPFSKAYINEIKDKVKIKFNYSQEESAYLVFEQKVKNAAYNPESDKINILFKDGTVTDVVEAADLLNLRVLSEAVEKYVLFYPKGL